nr:MAG: nonstructural polyprotein [Lake Sinai virus]UGV23672.1 MAG: nonstructural polyprotein [Lake Sinai virus]
MVKLAFAAALSVFLFCQVPPISHWIEDLVDDFDTMCSYEYAAADAYNAFVHRHRVAAYAAGVRVHRYRAPWYCAVSRSVPVVHPLGWLMSQYETTTGYVGELLERLDVANVTLADGLRVVAETAFTAYTYYQIIWFQLVFIVLLTGFFLALVCSSRVRVIRVRNRVRGYSATDLRADFEAATSDTMAPLSRGHSCLSFQRRVVESWCIDQLLGYFRSLRFVSTSQDRWTELGRRIHRCSPVVLDGSFIPEGSQCGTSCYRRPASCPDRFDVPACIISHVDYYMSREQLASVVTGPTFIINHDYSAPDTLSVAETGVRVDGGLVTSTVRDGPTYGPHPYHMWASEGVVACSAGAFRYHRVGRMFDTSLYYAFPVAGTYSCDDPRNLHRSTVGDLHYYSPHEKRFVSYSADAVNYYVFGASVPRSLADYCAATFCRSARDDKFYDSLRSYYQNRCRAIGFTDARDTLMLDFIIHLCDEASLKTFGFSRLSIAPSSWTAYCLSWVLVKVNHLMPLALTTFIVSALHRFFGAKSAPWNWATIHLPTYDMVTSPFRLKMFGRNPTTFNLERFRAEASVVGAPNPGQFAAGACEDRCKHDIESCNTSPPASSVTPSPTGHASDSSDNLLFDDESRSVTGHASPRRSSAGGGAGVSPNKGKTRRQPNRPADDNPSIDYEQYICHPKRPNVTCGPHFFMSVREHDESVPTLFHAHAVGGEDVTHIIEPGVGAVISKRFSASQLRLLSWSVDGIFNTLSRSATSSFVESSLLSLLRFMQQVPPAKSVTETRRCLLFGGPRQKFKGYDTFDLGFMGIAVPADKTAGVAACLREVARQHASADAPYEGSKLH